MRVLRFLGHAPSANPRKVFLLTVGAMPPLFFPQAMPAGLPEHGGAGILPKRHPCAGSDKTVSLE
jgi:hypothetical protein